MLIIVIFISNVCLILCNYTFILMCLFLSVGSCTSSCILFLCSHLAILFSFHQSSSPVKVSEGEAGPILMVHSPRQLPRCPQPSVGRFFNCTPHSFKASDSSPLKPAPTWPIHGSHSAGSLELNWAYFFSPCPLLSALLNAKREWYCVGQRAGVQNSWGAIEED